MLNPYGHVAFQAQRGDVHTVVVNGRVVKHDAPADRHRPGQGPAASSSRPSSTCRASSGREAWTEGMHPEIPETKVLDNPYTYTEWDAGSAQWKGTGRPEPE